MVKADEHYRGGYSYAGLLGLMRELRQRQTPAEACFWALVRDRRFGGLKFRRQHQLGLYIVDFYCHERRAVIELDGGIHDGQRQRVNDASRDAFLRSRGLSVFRIQNDLLLNAPDRVMHDLAVFLHVSQWRYADPTLTPSIPLSQPGEGEECLPRS